jgi:cellulose synthase operon protein B
VISLNRAGAYSYDLVIPESALEPPDTDRRHILEIQFISFECEFEEFRMFAVLSSNSYLTMPHELVSPPIDLNFFPRPLFQEDSFLPSTATMVIPDNPSESDLRAAMITSAGLGTVTGGDLLFELTTLSELSQAQKSSQSLIFVGKPAAFPILNEVMLPVSGSSGSFQGSGIDADSGLIQMGISPWSSTSSVTLVSGNSDVGVIKASHAVGAGFIQTTANKDYAIVLGYNPDSIPLSVPVDRSFSDLGYETITLAGLGIRDAYINFTVPPSLQLDSDAYLDLFYNNSTLVDFERSGMVIYLNGQIIGSGRFDETSTQLTTARIQIPKALTVPGENLLQIQTNFIPFDICMDYVNLDALWANFYSDSLLHLPMNPESAGYKSALQSTRTNLDIYPDTFAYGLTQGNVAFVLPEANLVSWQVASKIAVDFGDNLVNALGRSIVVFPADANETNLSNYDVIAVGIPSQLPFLYDIKDDLPAPFTAGSDIPDTSSMMTTYGASEGDGVGYIESIHSTWGEDRIAVFVLGSNQQGLKYAGNAITNGEIRFQLAGNLSVIVGDKIVSTYVPTNVDMSAPPAIQEVPQIATPAPGEPVMPTMVPATTGTQTKSPSKEWIKPIIGVSLALMLITVVIVIISSFRRKRYGG